VYFENYQSPYTKRAIVKLLTSQKECKRSWERMKQDKKSNIKGKETQQNNKETNF
jgi:hypothetical protein